MVQLLKTPERRLRTTSPLYRTRSFFKRDAERIYPDRFFSPFAFLSTYVKIWSVMWLIVNILQRKQSGLYFGYETFSFSHFYILAIYNILWISNLPFTLTLELDIGSFPWLQNCDTPCPIACLLHRNCFWNEIRFTLLKNTLRFLITYKKVATRIIAMNLLRQL